MSFMNYAVANSTESGAGQVIWLQFQKNPNHYANFIENPFELWINSYTQCIASTFEWKHLFDQVLCWASNSVGKQRSYISSFIYIKSRAKPAREDCDLSSGEQEEPCVFRVVPLGAPRTPKKCKVWKLICGHVVLAGAKTNHHGLCSWRWRRRRKQACVLVAWMESPLVLIQHLCSRSTLLLFKNRFPFYLGPTFKSIWFCFSDLIFQVFQVVNGTQELIASNWSRSAEVQTLESKKVVLKF